MKSPLFVLFSLVLIGSACSSGSDQSATNSEPVTIPADASATERIDLLIEANDYDSALAWLEGQDSQDPEIQLLFEKTWLNYGLHNMGTFDMQNMRTQMNNALRCFAEVLEINPQNQVARDQISQIFGVYRTMPDRSPEPDVVERLAAFGFKP